MFKSMRKNTTLISLAIVLLALAAYCQLLIPSFIAKGLAGIINGELSVMYLAGLFLAFSCKSAAQIFGSCLISYIESDTRFFLVNLVLNSTTSKSKAFRVTLIKEDAERIASAVSELIHLTGSCILTLSAAYILIDENILFCVPIVIVMLFTTYNIRSATAKIQKSYNMEIQKEEMYKESALDAFSLAGSEHPLIHASLDKSFRRLEDATQARYQYNKTTLILSFWPEIVIAFSTATIILISATLSPEPFGIRLIAYLGYIGIFSMASANSVRIALSLIGVNISVNRIFKGGLQ